jgi:hypothetical protein
MINRHGLARHIPEEIALEVRRRCGFGCVICGSSIVTYEHIDPAFIEAQTHDPDAIALLCAGCHDNVTRNRWSKSKVKRALASPYCKSSKFSWGEFDCGLDPPVVYVGNNLFWRCDVGIAVGPHALFSVAAPEEAGAPFRLSALFCDSHGVPVFQIRNNVWRANSQVWDIKVKGPLLTIKRSPDDSSLTLRALAGNGLRIERMNMAIGGVFVRVTNNALGFGAIGTPGQLCTGWQVVDCPVGIQL